MLGLPPRPSSVSVSTCAKPISASLDDNIVRFCRPPFVATAQKLTVFLTGLKLHLLLTFQETAAAAFKTGKAFPVLNILQAEDAKQISAFAGQINIGDRLSDQDVFRIYKTTVKGLVSASASKSKAVRLLKYIQLLILMKL